MTTPRKGQNRTEMVASMVATDGMSDYPTIEQRVGLEPREMAAIRERVWEEERRRGAFEDAFPNARDNVNHDAGIGHDDYECAARDRAVLLREVDRLFEALVAVALRDPA